MPVDLIAHLAPQEDWHDACNSCRPLAPITVTPASTTVNRQIRASAPPRDPWRVGRPSGTIHAGPNPARAPRMQNEMPRVESQR